MPEQVRSPETLVWSGSPSQWLNLGWFAFCLIAAAGFIVASVSQHVPLVAVGAAVPAVIAVWQWLSVRSTRIEISTERVTVQSGIFSRRREDLELYRIKDSVLLEPFLLRLVRRANILLRSSDRTTPSLIIPAVADAEALRQQIRGNVERLRALRGVREMDMDVES